MSLIELLVWRQLQGCRLFGYLAEHLLPIFVGRGRSLSVRNLLLGIWTFVRWGQTVLERHTHAS